LPGCSPILLGPIPIAVTGLVWIALGAILSSVGYLR